MTTRDYKHYSQMIDRCRLNFIVPDFNDFEEIVQLQIEKHLPYEVAEKLTWALLKKHPQIAAMRQEKVADRKDDRDYERISIRDRRTLRNVVGDGPVDDLKIRRKQSKAKYDNLFVAAHTGYMERTARQAMLDAALATWDQEKTDIHREFSILGHGGIEKYNATMAAAAAFRASLDTARAATDAIPDTSCNDWKPSFAAPNTIDEQRNITLFNTACSLIAKNLSPEAVEAALEAENNFKCYEPLDAKELHQILKSAERYRLRNQERATRGAKLRFTDTANAFRLIEEHIEYIRYVSAIKKWLFFDGVRWLFDAPGGLYELVRLTVKRLYELAITTLEGDERTRVLKELIGLESLNRQRAMIDTAATMPAVIVEPSRLDADLFLLNVNNGTIDLRTGSLRPHDARDLITKLAHVDYVPGATCPKFEAFLHRAMAGNSNLIAFLQCVVGYVLTGNTSEQCFFFLYGLGANGKSTFLNIIKALLGDYGMQAVAEMLMVKNNQGGANNDLARLPGARFVATSETEDGQRFAESALKQMTGQDTITARFLYGEFFEFVPQFKIFLAANHKPVVRGTDNAIWRRIHLIPFTVTIPEAQQDKNLESKLIGELPGILNWALAGCAEWQKNGLQPPEEVKAAVKEYKQDMDIFSQWLDACCVQTLAARTRSQDLYASYKDWATENTGWVLSQTKFGRTLGERGFIKELMPYAAWRGIGLLETRF